MHVKKGSRERSTASMLCSLKGKVLQLPLSLWKHSGLQRHNQTAIYSCKATLDISPMTF